MAIGHTCGVRVQRGAPKGREGARLAPQVV